MTPADTIAFAAAAIAACAFFATVWQAYLARTHNRLSVRPLLVWHRNRSITDIGTEVTLTVRNYGVGPAIIKDRYFMVDGVRFRTSRKSDDEVQELAIALLAQRFQYKLRQHGLPGTGTAIPQGGEHTIARIFFPNANDTMVDSILEQAGKVSFHIHYESLYGDRSEFLAK